MTNCELPEAQTDASLWTPIEWSDEAGNVLLVRRDGRPLYAHHLTMLLQLLWETTVGDVKHARKKRVVHTKRDIVAMFTPGDFKDFVMAKRFFLKHERGCRESAEEFKLSPYASAVVAARADSGRGSLRDGGVASEESDSNSEDEREIWQRYHRLSSVPYPDLRLW